MNKKLTAIMAAAAIAASLLAAPSFQAGVFASGDSSEASSESIEASSASEASSALEASSVSDASSASDASSTSEAPAKAYEESWDTDYEMVDEDLDPGECVKIGNYKGLEIEDVYVQPTDEDVNTFISSVMRPEAVKDPNIAAVLGDIVRIDYEGLLNGEAFDGGTASDYSLTLGSNTFIDGFEDGVVGMKAGEAKAIELTFPEDYWNSDLAGKEVTFNVTLHEISRVPELTDEWAAVNTGHETVEEYRATVLKDLEKAARAEANTKMENTLFEMVIKDTDFIKVPKSYYEDAKADFDTVNLDNAKRYGYTNLDEFLTALGVTKDYYNEMKDGYSRDAAKSLLLCEAIWAAEGMDKECEEYTSVLNELMEGYQMTEEELGKQYGEKTIKGYTTTYAVLARILSYAEVKAPEE